MHAAVPLASADLELPDLEATQALARRLAPALAAGAAQGVLIALEGDLGTGKTTFTRALLSALGHTGRVRSPSYTLMEPYNLVNFELYHFDFYRLTAPTDWLDAGFGDLVDRPGSVSVIEWAARAGDTLPAPDLRLVLAFGEREGARHAHLDAYRERGRAWLSAIAAAS